MVDPEQSRHDLSTANAVPAQLNGYEPTALQPTADNAATGVNDNIEIDRAFAPPSLSKIEPPQILNGNSEVEGHILPAQDGVTDALTTEAQSLRETSPALPNHTQLGEPPVATPLGSYTIVEGSGESHPATSREVLHQEDPSRAYSELVPASTDSVASLSQAEPQQTPSIMVPNGVAPGNESLISLQESDMRTAVTPIPKPVAGSNRTEVKEEQNDAAVVANSGLQSSAPVAESHAVEGEIPSDLAAPAQMSFSSSSLSKDQHKFSMAIIRSLRRHPDAPPFLLPVDPVAQGVPDYPKYISQPMDISTVEKKLQTKAYPNVDAFVSDMRLIFINCYKFNGSESPISKMAKNVEEVFEKQLVKMPLTKTIAEPAVAAAATIVDNPVENTVLSRQNDLAGPSYKRSPSDSRPRREIHPPASKDLPWALEGENRTGKRRRNDSRQLRFCRSVLHELHKKSHETYAFPFYNPVDAVALNLPDYHKVIKTPMDLSTIRKKLDAAAYPNPEAFEADIQLMFKNCYKYNPAGTAVNDYGRSLEAVFRRKWAERPEETGNSEDMYAEDSDISDHGNVRHKTSQISELEKQLEMMRSKILDLKSSHKEKRSNHSKSRSRSVKGSKAISRDGTKSKKSPKKRRKDGSSSEDRGQSGDENLPITFDQKRILSERINALPESRLAAVVNLIHEEMPHLAAQGGEIELEIEQLNNRTLNRLYQMVVQPKEVKRRPSGKKSGSQGTQRRGLSSTDKKRQTVDEHEQQRQIKALEQKCERLSASDFQVANILVKSFESGTVGKMENKLPSASESGDESSGVSTGDESGSESD